MASARNGARIGLYVAGFVTGVALTQASLGLGLKSLPLDPPILPGGVVPVIEDPVDVEPEPDPGCGWGQVKKASEHCDPPHPVNWTDDDWNPYTIGSAHSRGSGPNLSVDSSANTGCFYFGAAVCMCANLSTPWLECHGWSRSTMIAREGAIPHVPVKFRADARATVLLQGNLNAANWCVSSTGSVRVVSGATLVVSSNLPGMSYVESLITDVALAEGATTLTAGAGFGPNGPNASINASWTMGGDTAQLSIPPILFHKWGEWCGNPSGQYVQLDSAVICMVDCIDGSDGESKAVVREASVDFSMTNCDCVYTGGPTGIQQTGGSGFVAP